MLDSNDVRPRTRNLLVVDDEPIERMIIGRSAERLGWAVDEAASLAEARARIGLGELDAILIDLCLGEEDGLALLRMLREVTPHVVVVFISGADARILAACTRVARAMGLRVAGSLRKPIDRIRLEMLLQSEPERLPAARLDLPPPTAAQFEQALQNGEVYVAYQPTMDLRSGRLAGMEALARWHCPQRGDISPELFIPIAEASGLITPLTHEVLKTAVAACLECRRHRRDFSVAVNISPTLLSNEMLPSTIDGVLARGSLPHSALVAEITESTIATNPPLANEVLTRLSIKGVRLSIDDFGMGHSSLLSLLRSPFTELKIDRSFIEVCLTDPEAWKIVRSVLSLAHELGMRVVAEGIETKQLGDRLTDAGCDIGQGFFFGRPLQKDAMLDLLRGDTRSDEQVPFGNRLSAILQR